MIGSFNMDMRSAYLDTELMLVIDSPEINAQLRGVIADYQASSRLVRPDGTQTEGTAYVDVPLPGGKARALRRAALSRPPDPASAVTALYV